MLRIDKWNGRYCIFGFGEETGNKEIFLEAFKTLNLEIGKCYFIGSSRTFFDLVSEDLATCHRYRENWNGYHDLFKLNLKTGEKLGEVSRVAPEHGLHRQAFIK